MRAEEAVALRRLHTNEPEMARVLVAAAMPSRIDSLAGERQGCVVQQGIEVGAGEQRPGDLSTRPRVPLGLPVILGPDDEAHARGCAGAQAGQARLGQVGEQLGAPPGLVDRERPAVRRTGGTTVVQYPWDLPDGDRDRWLREELPCTCGQVGCPLLTIGALFPAKAPSAEAWAERVQTYYAQRRGCHARSELYTFSLTTNTWLLKRGDPMASALTRC
jgi:hypothetical protein